MKPRSLFFRTAFFCVLFVPGFLFAEEPTPAPEPARTREVEVAFSADFLRPGTDLHSEAAAQPIEFGRVTWQSSTEGDVAARMWDVNTTIHFQLTPGGRTFEKLVINPLDRGGSPLLWEVWRHRHAYLFRPGEGYVWNGFEDEKERIDDEDGRFYDAFLKGVWSLWTVKKLPAHLAATGNAVSWEAPSPQPPPPEMREHFSVVYDAGGLREPASFTYQFWAWNVPVRVTFDVLPSTTTAEGPAHYKSRWTYDESDWRRLHGYSKDLFGYSWDADFPHDGPLTREEGEKLDRLLDKTVEYWADAALQQVSAQIDAQLLASMREYAAELKPESEEEKRSRRDLNPRSLP